MDVEGADAPEFDIQAVNREIPDREMETGISDSDRESDNDFPQAFTHLALINAVMHVIRDEQEARRQLLAGEAAVIPWSY